MAYKGKKQLKTHTRKRTKPARGRNTAPRPFQKAPTGRPLSRNTKAPYSRKAKLTPHKAAQILFTKKLIAFAPKKNKRIIIKATHLFKRRRFKKYIVIASQRGRRRKPILRFLGKVRLRWRTRRRVRKYFRRRRQAPVRWRAKRSGFVVPSTRIFKKKAVKLPFTQGPRKPVHVRKTGYIRFLVGGGSRRLARLCRRVKKVWTLRKFQLARQKVAYRLQKALPYSGGQRSHRPSFFKLRQRVFTRARVYFPKLRHRRRRREDYRVRGFRRYILRTGRELTPYMLTTRNRDILSAQRVIDQAKPPRRDGLLVNPTRPRRLLTRLTWQTPAFNSHSVKKQLYKHVGRRLVMLASTERRMLMSVRTHRKLILAKIRSQRTRIKLPLMAAEKRVEVARQEIGRKAVTKVTGALQAMMLTNRKRTNQLATTATFQSGRKLPRRALTLMRRRAYTLMPQKEGRICRILRCANKPKMVATKARSRAQLDRREQLRALFSHTAKQTTLSATSYRRRALKLRRPRVEVTIPERFQGNHSSYLNNFRTTYRKTQGSYLGPISMKIRPLFRVAPSNGTRRIGLTSLPKFESGYGINIPKKKVLRRKFGFEPLLESVGDRMTVRNMARQLLAQTNKELTPFVLGSKVISQPITEGTADSKIRRKVNALFSRSCTNRRLLKKHLIYRSNFKAKQLGGRTGGARVTARLQRQSPHRLTAAGRVQKQRQLRAIFAAKRRAELKLSAWSPQYSLIYRRWSHPRVDGHPLQRDWTTRVEKRRRQLENESRALQGLEPIVYPDHAYIQLQYRDGNGTGAIGFDRYRRVYRPRSSSNRWWEAPANRPIPFTHPLSRISINNTDHTSMNVLKETFNRFRTSITFTSRRSAPGKKLQRRVRRKRKVTLTWARGKARRHTALRSARSNLRWMAQAPLARAERGNYWTKLDRFETNLSHANKSSHPSRRARRQWNTWHLPQLQADQGGESTSLLDRDNSRLYQRWLYGVERYLKQVDLARKGAGRREGEEDQLLRYGAARRRFPALALRETSFDSHLQGFARRIALPRFRRVNTIRFQRPRIKATHYRRDSLMYGPSSRLRRQRAVVQRLSAKRYLSPQWRALLNQRAATVVKSLDATTNSVGVAEGHPSDVVSKRRFDSLPAQVQFAQHLERAKAINVPSTSIQFRASLLRIALYRRRREREFLRLKKLARQRRMPAQSLLPPWQLAKRARTRAKVRHDMMWDTTELVERAHHQLPWAPNVVGFSTLPIADRVYVESPFYPSGEELLESEEIEKASWAQKGFHLDYSGTPDYPFHDFVLRRRKKSLSKRRILKSQRKVVRRGRRRGRPFARLAMRRRSNKRIRRFGRRIAAIRPFLAKATMSGEAASLYPLSRRALSSAMPAVKSEAAGVQRRSNAFAVRENAARTIGRKLVAGVSDHPIIAPLTFHKPIKVLPQSAEDKLREFRASVTLRERRYKLTAQYATGLTRQLPNFISKMVQTRLQQAKAENKLLTPQQVHAMVASMYWSLRVYLHVDPQEIKLALRDNNPTALYNMREAMSSLSQQQDTEHAARTAWRWRLQYGQTHRAPNSNHFRFAWLRRFFPKKYAIFLEDSDEYSAIPISTTNIERLQPNRTSPADWATNAPILTMESRARKLLRRRYTENTPRVETLLQTERRTPTVEPILHAAKTTMIGHASTPINSFFSRPFSTHSSLVFRGLRQHRRLTGTPEKSLLPAAEALTTRERVKPAMASLEQTGYLVDHGAEARNSALDARVLRGKSTRSGRYFIRLSDKRRALSDATTTDRLRLFHRYQELSKESPTRGVARTSRRFIYRSLATPAKQLISRYRSSNEALSPSILTGRKRVSTKTWSRGRIARPQTVFGTKMSKAFYDWHRYDRSLATRMFVLRNFTHPDLKEGKLAELNKLCAERQAKIGTRPNMLRRTGWTPLSFRLKRAAVKANTTRSTQLRAARIYYDAMVSLAQQYEDTDEYLELESDEAETYPFDEHRSELWDRLTLPWMKKERIIRDWVKNTKRWFTHRWGRGKASWMPPLVFGEIRRRARQLEWRERDDNFHRHGWRNAFRLYPSERRAAPWFEPLLFRRSAYSTRHGAYRRYQFPREQKRLKWLQRYRKSFVAPRGRKRYLKGRHWPRLRFYNQRLFRAFFNLRNRSAVRRHFEKLSRRQVRTNGFAHSLRGLANRVDTVLVQLNLVPTIYWARVLAPTGLLRVNGKVITNISHRLQPGDLIQLEQDKLTRFRHYFYPHSRYFEEAADWYRFSSAVIPGNFFYRPALRALIYRGLPTEEDLRKSSRLNSRMFRWFRLDGAVSK